MWMGRCGHQKCFTFFFKALEVGEFSKTFLILKPEKSGKEETKGKAALNSGCSSQYFHIIEYL